MRMDVYEASELDRVLHVEISELERIFGARQAKAVRAFFAHRELVRIASQRNLTSVLIVEDDVRPLGGISALGDRERRALSRRLEHPWSVVRATGLYRSQGGSSGRRRAISCSDECRCVAVPGAAKHVCEVAAPRARQDTHGIQRGFCQVRDTTVYAVSAAAYPTFLRAHERAKAALERLLVRNQSGGAGSARGMSYARDDFDAPVGIPWFDIWLPATLDAIHILPSLAVQQTKQGTFGTSVRFARHCFVASNASLTLASQI